MSFLLTNIEQTYQAVTSTIAPIQKIIMFKQETKTFELNLLIVLIAIIALAALVCILVCLACLDRFRFLWMPLSRRHRNNDEKSKDVENNEKQLAVKKTHTEQKQVINRSDHAERYNRNQPAIENNSI